MESMNYSKGYKYNPDYIDPVEQEYLPSELKTRDFYDFQPTKRKTETGNKWKNLYFMLCNFFWTLACSILDILLHNALLFWYICRRGQFLWILGNLNGIDMIFGI